MVENNDPLREMVLRHMPLATEPEIQEAVENLRWYVGFCIRMADRIEQDEMNDAS